MYDRLIADLAFVDMAERAAGDGCDGILVDSIVLGCTCMAPTAAEVAARIPVPLVEGCRVAPVDALLALADASPRPATATRDGLVRASKRAAEARIPRSPAAARELQARREDFVSSPRGDN